MAMSFGALNPLLHEFCFEIYPMIGSYRLPSHRRSAHRDFFLDPLSYSKIEIVINVYLQYGSSRRKGRRRQPGMQIAEMLMNMSIANECQEKHGLNTWHHILRGGFSTEYRTQGRDSTYDGVSMHYLAGYTKEARECA